MPETVQIERFVVLLKERPEARHRMHLDLEVAVIVLSLMTRFKAVLGAASLFL